MSGKATVTYFHHSGFMVAVGETLMVFDYWRGENGEIRESAALSENDFKGFEQVLFLCQFSGGGNNYEHIQRLIQIEGYT